ncbi:MAG: TolB protein [Frankiales bacterium]|jgi:Tol biopolymer transport system component|nr:TolB protein [Frankiales bacterium]
MREDLLLEQLADGQGPVDPGLGFRDALWELIEAEMLTGDLVAEAPAVVAVPAPRAPASVVALTPPSAVAHHHRRFTPRRLALLAAAVLLPFLLLVLALGGGSDGKSSIRVVDPPTPEPTAQASGAPTPPLQPGGRPSAAPGAPVPVAPAVVPAPRPHPYVGGGDPGSAASGLGWYLLYADYTGNTVNGYPDYDIYRREVGPGQPARRLVHGPGAETNPVLSPDRRHLAWSGPASYDGSVSGLYVGDADGGHARSIPLPPCGDVTTCPYLAPSWSPDSKRLAFNRNGPYTGCTAVDGCDLLYSYDLTTSKLTQLANGHQPDWSPRRDEIVYAGHQVGPASNADCFPGPYGEICEAAGDISIIDVSGPSPTIRTLGMEKGWTPRFSPDGEWIVFDRELGSTNIRETAVMRRDGTSLRTLSACHFATWTPDGRLACTIQQADGSNDVWLLDAHDQPVRQLTFTANEELGFRIYRD